MYIKSPKKCRELDDVITEMKAYFEESEFTTEGGNHPLQACRTRFIAHKVSALNHFIERYGVYLNYLPGL